MLYLAILLPESRIDYYCRYFIVGTHLDIIIHKMYNEEK